MSKDKVKEKIKKNGRHIYLSAQEYKNMARTDKDLIREVLEDDGDNPDEYETRMKALWPKDFTPKQLNWRGK